MTHNYEPDTKQEILDAMVESAEASFGEDFDPDQETIFRAHYDSIAEYLAEQQQDIKNVLDANRLDSAIGEELDSIGALVGISRKQSLSSDTVLQFSSDPAVTTDRTVPQGTQVQTDDTNAIKFETDSDVTLDYIDGFEDGDLSEYTDSSSAFSVSTSVSYNGSNSIVASDNGNTGVIEKTSPTDYSISDGSKIDFYFRTVGSTAAGFLFGMQDASNYYRIQTDAGNAEVNIEVIESGSVSSSVADGGNIENATWHRAEVEWSRGTEINLTVTNTDTGNVTHTATLDESSQTYESGTIGFEDLDGSSDTFFDEVAIAGNNVAATSVGTGPETNVGAGTVTVFNDSILGVDSVTNLDPASGGRSEETDDTYRQRIGDELSEGTNATADAIIRAVKAVQNVRTVSYVDNDTDSTDGSGRPPHSFEIIADVDSSFEDEVAQAIVDTKAAGDTSVGGYAGTSVTKDTTLVNGDTKQITFSVPTQTQIYYDIDIETTSSYPGDDAVRDEIVRYTGGLASSGTGVSGEIEQGEDVIFYQVAEAIMDVEGVFDITNLEIGTTSSPTGTSNVTISTGNTAYTDGTDTSSVDVTSSAK